MDFCPLSPRCALGRSPHHSSSAPAVSTLDCGGVDVAGPLLCDAGIKTAMLISWRERASSAILFRAVERPLDPGTAAAFRSILRRCCALRAAVVRQRQGCLCCDARVILSYLLSYLRCLCGACCARGSGRLCHSFRRGEGVLCLSTGVPPTARDIALPTPVCAEHGGGRCGSCAQHPNRNCRGLFRAEGGGDEHGRSSTLLMTVLVVWDSFGGVVAPGPLHVLRLLDRSRHSTLCHFRRCQQ